MRNKAAAFSRGQFDGYRMCLAVMCSVEQDLTDAVAVAVALAPASFPAFLLSCFAHLHFSCPLFFKLFSDFWILLANHIFRSFVSGSCAIPAVIFSLLSSMLFMNYFTFKKCNAFITDQLFFLIFINSHYAKNNETRTTDDIFY